VPAALMAVEAHGFGYRFVSVTIGTVCHGYSPATAGMF
jgi:hypothetical protein